MTREEIEAIDALEKKATPGPWKYGRRNDEVTPASLCYEEHEGHFYAVMMSPRYGLKQFQTDAAFIAALREQWPALRDAALQSLELLRKDAITVKSLVWLLEGSAVNTDTDWRWRAASALRECPQWESAAIKVLVSARKEQSNG